MGERLLVKWTVLHRYWNGDDYAGDWVQEQPPETCIGTVVGFSDGKAVVKYQKSLELHPLDELTVLE